MGSDSGGKPVGIDPENMTIQEYLEIYLNDHAAGAAAGVMLARRLARSNRRSPWADRLQEVAAAVEEDARTLESVRSAVGADGGTLKRVGALLVERAGHFKFNGHLLTYSPLSRLLELEGLMGGVQAKHRLWVALARMAPHYPGLKGFDFVELESRATTQLATLASAHEWAASELATD